MSSPAPNTQYNVAAAGSLPVRIAAYERRRMFARSLDDTGLTDLRASAAGEVLGMPRLEAAGGGGSR